MAANLEALLSKVDALATPRLSQPEEGDIDGTTAPPQADLDALLPPGLFRDIALAGADGKEVSPVSVALAAMVWLSAEFGPDVFLRIGDQRHNCRIYAVHVGRTSRGGKGESLSLVKRIRQRLDDDTNFLAEHHNGGLSSREGLCLLLHDGEPTTKPPVPPVVNKRLFIVEPEFSNVLAQGKREGNSLLPALRDCWDVGSSIKPLSKSSRALWATAPHIAILGNITPFELRAKLAAHEIHGGTLNRFLVIFAERTCLVPWPAPTASALVDRLASRCRDAIEFAKGGYGAALDPDMPPEIVSRELYKAGTGTREAGLDTDARALWEASYAALRDPLPGEVLAAATERRAPMALRLALLFALSNGRMTITAQDLAAGVAWVSFGAESIKYVFGGGEAGLSEDAEKILAHLEKHGKTPRVDLRAGCFRNHIKAADLDAALQSLLDSNRIERSEARTSTGAVRPQVSYELRSLRSLRSLALEQASAATRSLRNMRSLEADHGITEL